MESIGPYVRNMQRCYDNTGYYFLHTSSISTKLFLDWVRGHEKE